jgi:hypothetical protein
MSPLRAQVVASTHKMQDLCKDIELGSRAFGDKEYDRAAPSSFFSIAVQMQLLMVAPEQVRGCVMACVEITQRSVHCCVIVRG